MKITVADLKQIVKHLEKEKVEDCIIKLEGHLFNIYFNNSVIHIEHVDSKKGVMITTKEKL